jgi:hypothetical protein
MDSQNGLPNSLDTELQPHALVQPGVFTVDSQTQQPTSLFSVDEQLIKDSRLFTTWYAKLMLKMPVKQTSISEILKISKSISRTFD